MAKHYDDASAYTMRRSSDIGTRTSVQTAVAIQARRSRSRHGTS